MRKYLDLVTKPPRGLIEKAEEGDIRRILEVKERAGLNGYVTVRGSWEFKENGNWVTYFSKMSYQKESTISARINKGSYQEIPA